MLRRDGAAALSSAAWRGIVSERNGRVVLRAGNVLDKFPQSVQSRVMTMLGELWQAPSLIRLWSRRIIPLVMDGRALVDRGLPEAAA